MFLQFPEQEGNAGKLSETVIKYYCHLLVFRFLSAFTSTFGAVDTAFKLPFTDRTSGPGGSSVCTDLRSVSQQGPQRISWQGLDSGKLECFRLLSVESDVLAALEVSFQLLATVQTHQIPRPHPPQDFPHGLHLPVRQTTCRTKNKQKKKHWE